MSEPPNVSSCAYGRNPPGLSPISQGKTAAQSSRWPFESPHKIQSRANIISSHLLHLIHLPFLFVLVELIWKVVIFGFCPEHKRNSLKNGKGGRGGLQKS